MNDKKNLRRNAILGPISISDKTSYRKISWCVEVARFVFRIVWSLSNMTGTSADHGSTAADVPVKFQSDAIIQSISRLRELTRSYNKTSYRLLKRGPGARVCNTNKIPLHDRPAGWTTIYDHYLSTNYIADKTGFVDLIRPQIDRNQIVVLYSLAPGRCGILKW